MKNAPHPRSYPALRDTVHWLRAHILAIWLIAFPPLLLIVGMREKNEIVRVLDTLRGAESSWLLLGIGIEALIVLGPVLTYRIILSRLGHVLPFSSLVGMHMQRIVVGTLAPVSGPASAFAFVRALNHRAVATHDALTMLALRSVTTQTAFVLLMLGAIAARGPIYALSVGAVVVVLLIVMAPLLRRA